VGGLALVGLVAVAALAVAVGGRPDLADLLDTAPGPVPAPTGAPTTAATGPPPLCELLGDLGVGDRLGPPSADLGFTDPAEARGAWLPDPAALPRALRRHQFRSGCTRTWAGRDGPVVAALFQFPGRPEALAARRRLRDGMGARGVEPARVPQVTGGELYLLGSGGGHGQLVMFVCNERVLQLHVAAADPAPDPRLVELAQGANRRLHERTGCPL
jgi:hypothetical protein